MIGSYFNLVGHKAYFNDESMYWHSAKEFERCIDRLFFPDGYDHKNKEQRKIKKYFIYTATCQGEDCYCYGKFPFELFWNRAAELEEKRLEPYRVLKKQMESALRCFSPDLGKCTLDWDAVRPTPAQTIVDELEEFFSEQLFEEEDFVSAVVEDVHALELVTLALELARRSLLCVSNGCAQLDENVLNDNWLPTSLREGSFYYMEAVGFDYASLILRFMYDHFCDHEELVKHALELALPLPRMGEERLNPLPLLEAWGWIGRDAQLTFLTRADGAVPDDRGDEKFYWKQEYDRLVADDRARHMLPRCVGDGWWLRRRNELKSKRSDFEWVMGLCKVCQKRFAGTADDRHGFLCGSTDVTVQDDGTLQLNFVSEFGVCETHYFLHRGEDNDFAIWLFGPDSFFYYLTDGMPESETFFEWESSEFWNDKPVEDKRYDCDAYGVLTLDYTQVEELGFKPEQELVLVGVVDHFELKDKQEFEEMTTELSDLFVGSLFEDEE